MVEQNSSILTEEQLEKYFCLICTSICEQPVKLGCTHLFCLGCLKKLTDIQAKEKHPNLQ